MTTTPAPAPATPGAATTERTKATRIGPLRALLPFVSPYRWHVVGALVCLVLAAGSTLAMPLAVRLLVDHGLAPAGAVAVTGAGTAGIGAQLVSIRGYFLLLFAVAIAVAVFGSARFYLVSWIGERVTTDLRGAVYSHILGQSPRFFETVRTGEVLSRLTTDTTVIQTAVGSSISLGLRNAVLFIGGMALLIATSPRLMLLVLAVIGLVVAPAAVVGRRVRRLSRASQDRLADTSGIAGEVLNAIPIVQSFRQEKSEAARFAQANERAFSTAIRRTRTRALLTTFVIVGVFASLLYGLYRGVQEVVAGRATSGELSQTALYIMLVASSVAVLAEVWGELLRAAGATERLIELLATEPAIADPPDPRPMPPRVPGRGLEVRFDEVAFAYPSRLDRPVFVRMSLAIAAGQTVALVGPSGAGKTTLFSLLQRFYDVDAGALTLDGVDVRATTLRELRERIAVVPQEAVIFSGSVLDNIRYGRAGASDEDVWRAARAAHVEEYVQHLPEGYRTFVGERGLRLSGGQRQRLAIARAILKDAPLLLLDEATSSLDAESERAVQAALDEAVKGRTTIVIAHRLATVQRADRIFVLDHGEIVEAGTHAELAARGGLYARLAALQFVA
jgi:ATP-binding cassette, subfamily B, bacterial